MTGLRHVGIVVTDADMSARFYGDYFGFETLADGVEEGEALSRQLAITGVSVRTVKMRPPGGGALLELLQFRSPRAAARDPRPLAAIGLTHIALTVADADAVYTRLRDGGFVVRSAPTTSADGKVEMFFCADPNGVQLEIVQEKAA